MRRAECATRVISAVTGKEQALCGFSHPWRPKEAMAVGTRGEAKKHFTFLVGLASASGKTVLHRVVS